MGKKHTLAQPKAPAPKPVTEQQLLAFLASDARNPAEGYRAGMFALASDLGYVTELFRAVRLRGYLDALVADACASGLHIELRIRARALGCLNDVITSVRSQGLLPAFFAASRDGSDFAALVVDAASHDYMGDLLADARQHGYLSDLLHASHVTGGFAALISTADPLDVLLKDAAQIGPYLPMLLDAARSAGLLPKVLGASYAAGLVADILGWAKKRDCLDALVSAAEHMRVDTADSDVNALLPGAHSIRPLLGCAAPLGYVPDLLAAAPGIVDIARKHGHAEAVVSFERDVDSIPVLNRPYSVILDEVERDLEARRDPFAFGSVADMLITMEGLAGVALREKYGTAGAARMIHRKSRPEAPALRCDDDTPQGWIVAYLRERAAEEPAVVEEPSVAVA